jgi:hypothetical protein
VSHVGWCLLIELVLSEEIGVPCRLVPANIIVDWCLL